jgi:hypothetical protein
MFLSVSFPGFRAMKHINDLLRCELQPSRFWQRVNWVCCIAFIAGFIAVLVIAAVGQD